MLRIYSASGPAILRTNIKYLGGHLDCLGPDSSGGVFAILGSADRSHIAFLQTLTGVTVLPNNMAAPAPTLPAAASSVAASHIPVSTTGDLLSSIHSAAPNPLWDPNFA